MDVRMSSDEWEDRKRRFGAAMQHARMAAGISQTDLGATLDSNQANVSNYERGRNAPEPETCFRIEDALNLPPGSLSQFLGYVPVGVAAVPCSFGLAIAEDPHLDDYDRRALSAMYETLTRRRR